jgi:hypothetical protein
MIQVIKIQTLVTLSFPLMLLGCGSRSDNHPDQTARLSNEHSSPIDNLTKSSCTETLPPDDLPQAYCKTLNEGQIYSVTLKGSRYEQNPETCVVTVVDDELKTSLLEMGFEPCDSGAESESSNKLAGS